MENNVNKTKFFCLFWVHPLTNNQFDTIFP
ncbi:uncharacterized protein METZ01_LOCUS454677, partial [marine metagenome]